MLAACFVVGIYSQREVKAATKLDDGEYSITGKLQHATQDQPSMGNAALAQPMKIIKKGDRITLCISLLPISMGTGKGYLYGFEYYPDVTDMDTVPEGKRAESANVLQYYKTQDAFNHAGTGTDERVKGKKYPRTIQISVKQDCAWIWTRIYVPIMESISKGSGDQFARLVLDWSTLKKTKAAEVQKTPAPTKKPRVKKYRAKKQTEKKESKKSTADTTKQVPSEKKKTVKSNCRLAVSYRHPVTGTIEDAGGESAFATGQGMAESAIDTKANWKKMEDGKYRLTVKLRLMDYTSNHVFWIQKRGEETWKKIKTRTTGQGKDDNGTFSYVTLTSPYADPVLKISMFVKPMERNVIFYASFDQGQETPSIETKRIEKDTEEGLRLSTQTQETEPNAETQETNEKTDTMTMSQWMITLILSLCISGLILLAAAAAIVYYFRRNWRRWGEEMEDDEE